MRTCCLYILFSPVLIFSQEAKWQIESNLGFNLSINQMKTLEGNANNMANSIIPGGYWSILAKRMLNKKMTLRFGVDHAAYKYLYKYRLDYAGGTSSTAKVFIWGFPIGIEHTWLGENFNIGAGYGVKYRINRSGSPFSLEATNQAFNLSNELVLHQELKEYEVTQQSHLLSIFVYTQLIFQIKTRFQLTVQIAYNQGLNTHESFKFESINQYPLERRMEIDRYQYSSRVNYLSGGLGFTYSFLKPKKLELTNMPLVEKD